MTARLTANIVERAVLFSENIMMRETMYKKKENLEYGIITVLSVGIFLTIAGMLTGKGLQDSTVYNSYALQADSWRQGRLDLGQDYPWLELAIYQGKYYVSFPPFPSYILFPLTFFFGSNTPDACILFISNLLCTFYMYRLAVKERINPQAAMLETLLAVICSNYVFVMLDPSVWFIAQAMCVTLSVAAVYYAVEGRGGLALALWACSVGCRPMQIVFLPLLLYLLYQKEHMDCPERKVLEMIRRRALWFVPVTLIAVSYMVLNYVRFGNILEFGRKYLPEFVNESNGQFNVIYMKEHIRQLFAWPRFDENGRMIIDNMGNLSMMLITPVFTICILCMIYSVAKGNTALLRKLIFVSILATIYMTIIVMHRTMGAWQFGNRYSNDIIPWIYLGILWCDKEYPGFVKYHIPFAIWGLSLNLVGSVAVYNWWI